MGGCSSREVKAATATAKVILENGSLMEIAAPFEAMRILIDCPGSFICDADDMNFEDCVREIHEEEELSPGQIYFLLPRSMLRRRLQLEEMVALAVKASSALMKSGYDAALRCESYERHRTTDRFGGRRSFVSRLGVIPEDSAHDCI